MVKDRANPVKEYLAAAPIKDYAEKRWPDGTTSAR
jgi:hypothetical protein